MEDRKSADFTEWNRDRFVEFNGDSINLPIKVSVADIQKLINRLESKPADYLMPFYRLAKEYDAKGDVNVSMVKRNGEIFMDMMLTLRRNDSMGYEVPKIIRNVSPITDMEYERLLDIGNSFCKEMYNKSLDEKLDELVEHQTHGFGGINEEGKYYFVEDGNYGDENIIPKEDIKEYGDIDEITEMVMNSNALNWIPYETKDCVKQLMGIFLEDKIEDAENSQSIPISMCDEFVDKMEFNYDRWNQNLLNVICYENADEFVIDLNEKKPKLFSERGNIKKVKGRSL